MSARGMRNAPVQVMTALQSILVPVDGSAPSLAALEHAISLAENLGARIDVLHVEVDALEESPSPLTSSIRGAIEPAAKAAMTAEISAARDRLGDRLSVRTEVGDPLRTIVTVANEGRYQLIVIGTHGRVGRLHAMLGSVAEGVVRNAPCPVLTVRPTGSGYQSFAERRHGRPTLAEQFTQRH